MCYSCCRLWFEKWGDVVEVWDLLPVHKIYYIIDYGYTWTIKKVYSHTEDLVWSLPPDSNRRPVHYE